MKEERHKGFKTGNGWVQQNKPCQKKNSSESPGPSYVKGLLWVFLHICTSFKTSRNDSSGPPSLGRSLLEDVSQPWLIRIFSLFSCSFSASCYGLLSVHFPGCAGVQCWQHGWDCLIQITPSWVCNFWEPRLKTLWRHTFPPSFRSAITTRFRYRHTSEAKLAFSMYVWVWRGIKNSSCI